MTLHQKTLLGHSQRSCADLICLHRKMAESAVGNVAAMHSLHIISTPFRDTVKLLSVTPGMSLEFYAVAATIHVSK